MCSSNMSAIYHPWRLGGNRSLTTAMGKCLKDFGRDIKLKTIKVLLNFADTKAQLVSQTGKKKMGTCKNPPCVPYKTPFVARPFFMTAVARHWSPSSHVPPASPPSSHEAPDPNGGRAASSPRSSYWSQMQMPGETKKIYIFCIIYIYIYIYLLVKMLKQHHQTL